MAEGQPVRIILTPEQRESVRRASGHDIEAIELDQDDLNDAAGSLRLKWRLSLASGIPRQEWSEEDETPQAPSN
ncbi:MAG TPA: hypothetical protein VMH39_14350 [Gemmatimonadaceae bacterium]|nr:hypothetical protein [Gemmatimonadaceae bacterium]